MYVSEVGSVRLRVKYVLCQELCSDANQIGPIEHHSSIAYSGIDILRARVNSVAANLGKSHKHVISGDSHLIENAKSIIV